MRYMQLLTRYCEIFEFSYFFCTVIVFSEEVASKYATNLYIFGIYIFGAFGRYVKGNLWEGIDCNYVFILVPELLLV